MVSLAQILMLENMASLEQSYFQEGIRQSHLFAKVKGLIAEYLITIGRKLSANQSLSEDEEEWYCQFHITPQSTGLQMGKFNTRQNWQLQLSNHDFQKWKSAQHSYTLFFYGTSKGNPGVAGAGWGRASSLTPKEQLKQLLHGVLVSPNNQAEAYALLQGLRIANGSQIQSLIVVGDSKAVISQMILNTTPVDNILASVIAWAKQEAEKFIKISYYEVLRENYHQADQLAKVATTLKVGVLNLNGITNHQSIP